MNAQTQIARDYSRAQTNAECRLEAARRDIRERYDALHSRLITRMQGELDRVTREFWEGKSA